MKFSYLLVVLFACIQLWNVDAAFIDNKYEVDSRVIELFRAMESGESDVHYASLALPPENKNIGVASMQQEPTPLQTTQDLLDELIEVAEKTEIVKNPNKPRCVLSKTPGGVKFLFWKTDKDITSTIKNREEFKNAEFIQTDTFLHKLGCPF